MTPNQWILSHDTGTSSKAIWGVMMGLSKDAICADWGGSTPCDPDDFGRCYRLLQHFPEWRERLPEVAKILPHWSPMIREWDKLTEMYERVVAGDGWDRRHSKPMYEFMRQLNGEKP